MISRKKSLSRHSVFAIVLVSLSLGACASQPKQSDRSTSVTASRDISIQTATSWRDGDEPAPGSVIQAKAGEIIVRDVSLKNTQFDFPVTINSRVEYWVDYFLGRGRQHFARYLERSDLFIPYIRPLLRANGMPEDLVYLAMIESGFNNHAKSHAKAVGPWQFIAPTGKRYGLMINWWVDERRDTRKSTIAAAGYLKDLYTYFGSWELAAAGYNAGEAKVARAIQRFGSKDFWVISRHRYLRRETRDYVPKIIAAALLAKNREQFGFDAAVIHPAQDEIVAGDGEVVKVEEGSASEKGARSMASVGDEEEEETMANILQQEGVEQDNEDLSARVVPVTEEGPDARPVPTPHVDRKGELSGTQMVEFEVKSPSDLQSIAKAANLSYHTVKALNPEILRWVTPPSVSSYRIKLPAAMKDRFLEAYNHSAFVKRVKFLTYKVRSGDTLSKVARNFGIHVDPMSDLNGISPRAPLRAGSKVLLPLPADSSRSLASLDVRDAPERRRKRRGLKQAAPRVNQKKRQSAGKNASVSLGG